MDNEMTIRDAVKIKYGFERWSERASSVSASHIERPFLPDLESYQGFRFVERRPFPNFARGFSDLYEGMGENAGAHLQVTLCQYSSVEAAHEGLIDFLVTTMAPQLPTLEELGIRVGDVGFGGMTDVQSSIIFCRGNVLVRAHAYGQKLISVVEYARILDAQIRSHIEEDN